ncbi:PHA/PHB synthase family protein [Granulosicoccus antarcticus]|uniref:Poly-beta-hydroxybutyrate polymerase n=1 Tax=Granulosicoccus antarcticus IMCC3135 TaxID=1192854 RepID=A0A2Z2NQ59_9GAMM|nr:class I poly(R)-hydroxyalkanoic acid synthase [Granulosicoccus antarcticus]ASJ72605.1 Poly-beta-hydroxybutyrate polymerase [Granulosicoccus antarcticus IMCC3135]
MTDKEDRMQDQMEDITRSFADMWQKNTTMMSDLLNKSHQMATQSMDPMKGMDPMNVGPAFNSATKLMASDPMKLMQANYELWKEHVELMQQVMKDLMKTGAGSDGADKGDYDRRFKHEAWTNNPMFDYIRRSYLITSRWMVNTMTSIEGLSEQDKKKIVFHSQLLADAFSPSNFLLTNPEAIRTMFDTGGQSIMKGLQNLQRDLDPKTSQLTIMMSDPDAFTLGENIATTPGKVVFQNELAQLIQYEPTTDKVHKRPLVIAPPWINKYYILDLQPKNSFIAWAVSQGYTVFVISWVNPDAELGNKTFEDYMQEGILDALDAVEEATGEREVSMIGYCIGGTLLSATLAYMAATGDDRVKAATFFASQADFSEAGDLKIFTDEAQVNNLERMMDEKGYLDGSSMSSTFNMLRANDLIWSFYVDNYLLGKEPMKFDLLYWNADSTRMPRKTHLFYLREMYINNNLSKPGGISLKGIPIDLSKVTIPVYLQAAKEDHIAPYPSVFKSTGLYAGPVRFMLAGSGHIAGVINPPAAEKYNYWINEDQPKDLDAWMEGAEEFKGSWWTDWDKWLAPLSGKKVAKRIPGSGKLDVIEPAPGSFVTVKS